MTEFNEDIATAYHEAGHAVIAWLYAVPFEYLEICTQQEDGTLGFVQLAARIHSSRRGFNYANSKKAYCTAGGPLAQEMYYKTIGKKYDYLSLWSDTDIEGMGRFRSITNSYGTSLHPVTQAVEDVMKRDDVKLAISALAGLLLAKRRVSSDEAIVLMTAHIPKKGKLTYARMFIEIERNNAMIWRAAKRMSA